MPARPIFNPDVVIVNGAYIPLEFYIGSARHKIALEELAELKRLQHAVSDLSEDIKRYERREKGIKNAYPNSR